MPRALLDCGPCKRPRLGWDVGPAEMHQVQIGLCGQEVVNAISAVELGFSSEAIVSSPVNQEQPRDESTPLREDDKYGRYVFAVGDNLTSRCTFGQVLECWDRERKEMVAIKITRGTKTYRDAAMIEIGILEQLGKYDKSRSRLLVYISCSILLLCSNTELQVFEKLGPSLCDFLQKNIYRSFPVALVREVAKQLLECLAFMHELRLMHTDLKPENILLVSPECIKVPDYKASSRSPMEGSYYKWLPKSNAIKVIDFGSTIYGRLDQSYLVSIRHYRAPEVILGHGWSYPCDIWSVGCILIELCTSHSAKYIREGRLNWPGGCTSWERMKAVTKLPRLQSLVMRNVDQSAGDIIDLLQGLLKYDPANRLTAQEALRHPFFTEEF
ncbi:hypothetical protein BDA96_01G044500 [Sorghum bicolor]|uniref:Protein kinase domain-containing protein n=2 Tax=Sorghum bicolor TaxID=4558 RepID=A0A921RX12_SORBI|nr:hypothetical protein BDA96_01G044500 [Sorghum bicolor]KXG37288.1 hypothetical protein SORBI_3001G043300 [Sorghum bicolor]